MQAHMRRYPRVLLSDLDDVHVRRTLDQFSLLFQDDISARDRDQVVYRATRNTDPRITMIDQLWIWVLNDGVSLSQHHSVLPPFH